MTVPASTAIEAALDGFLAACHAAIDPDPTLGGVVPRGVGVFDSDPLAGQPESAYVQVAGWDITSREPATFGSPAGFFTIEEQFMVTGSVWAFDGSSTQKTSRKQAVAIFSAVEAQVRDDPTLGGAVRAAWFARHTGTQGVTAQGGTGTQIDYELHCEVRIQ